MKVFISESDVDEIVFCKQCGAIPGKPTDCPGWRNHTFINSTVPVICEHCGAIPGKATKCAGWDRHNFLPIPDPK